MLLLGIPHGAVDHQVFFSKFGHSLQGQPRLWGQFLGFYLGIILLYALLWYFFPLFCFSVFLLFSAYHFGQSQLYYLAESFSKGIISLLYLLWGTLLLGTLLYWHQAEARAILAESPLNTVLQPLLVAATWCLPVLALLWAALMVFYVPFKSFLKELILLAILFVLISTGSLLWAFAIYFALWHSLLTIQQEIAVFRKQAPEYRWQDYVKSALPFSLLSFLGIGLVLLALAYTEVSQELLILSFFILVSLLTAPHAWVIRHIYPA
jgi:Brp/Blh family beta-carotene 15,15'-monooxygenase